MEPSDFQIYLKEKLDAQSEHISGIKEDLTELKIDVGIMKGSVGPYSGQKLRMRDSAAGGSIGAVLVGVIMAAWEYFKAKAG